jgi:hypothetical protein
MFPIVNGSVQYKWCQRMVEWLLFVMRRMSSFLSGRSLLDVCVLIIENSTTSLGRIISPYPSSMKYSRGWLTTPSATWMVTLVIIISRSIWTTRVRPPLHVHMVRSLTGECHLGHIMLQHHFKGA